ncbi:acyltransferase family protein [Sphingobacterium sp. SGL-16]|uniref:acyltransferase family protein n=1 Tax=Sphingobacterium sp. SGL-16 TaxID=2710883 RepID=UPI0013ECD629|nr:acyltransferase family protein [Sphingobacterium sp. SGL-16]
MTYQRDNFLDSAKALLIFLVILGHVIGPYRESNNGNQMMRNIIYLFHMPLFVFISGYFSKSKDFYKFRKSLFSILESLIFFQILYLIPKLYYSKFQISYLYTPNWILWYLLSLIFWKTIVFYLPKKFSIYIVIISIILCLLVGFTNVGYELSLSRSFVFLPFFILGYYINEKQLYYIRSYNKIISTIILLFVVLIFINHNMDLSLVFSGAHSYFITFDNIWLSFSFRVIYLFGATIVGISILNLLPTFDFLARLGSKTIVFYLLHGFFIIGMQKMIDIFKLSVELYVLIVFSLFIFVILSFISSTHMINYLINPVSSFLKLRKSNKGQGISRSIK